MISAYLPGDFMPGQKNGTLNDLLDRMLEGVEELTDDLSLLMSSAEPDHDGSGLIMNGVNDTSHTK